MKIYKTSLALLLAILYLNAQAQIKTARTESGEISGLSIGEVQVFKGVPYAAPPVGDLRWRAPQPAAKWEGVRVCDTFPPSAIQANPVPFMMWTQEFITPAEPMSEDCLYLNIWTAAKNKKEKRPVFVWIHGGAFTSGSGHCAVYDGEEMAKKGVIFVSINYRLGVFGFFAHPDLTKESGIMHASGNYGLMDQIAALKWIKTNIAAFGGDPANVTIAGQSAGSMSVMALVASPQAKGLFHRAIAQSGGIFSNRMAKNLENAETSGGEFLIKSGAATIDALRKMPGLELRDLAATMPFGTFAPILDGYVLPEDLIAHFKQGKHNDVPLIMGWVTGDGALSGNQPSSVEKFKITARENYGPRSGAFLKLFPVSNDQEATAALGKLSLISFAALPAHLASGFNQNKSWVYEFSHVPPDKPGFPNYGAFHTSEVPYALNTLKKWDRPWQALDFGLANTMSDYWVNFAKTGNPNAKGLPEWKSYDKQAGNILELGDKVMLRPGHMKTVLDFMEEAAQ